MKSSISKAVPKNSQNLQENICARTSFLIKFQPLGLLIVLLNSFIIKYYSCFIMLITIDTILSKNIYNQFHNVLKLFNVLQNFPFTTSETMWDYYL